MVLYETPEIKLRMWMQNAAVARLVDQLTQRIDTTKQNQSSLSLATIFKSQHLIQGLEDVVSVMHTVSLPPIPLATHSHPNRNDIREITDL